MYRSIHSNRGSETGNQQEIDSLVYFETRIFEYGLEHVIFERGMTHQQDLC